MKKHIFLFIGIVLSNINLLSQEMINEHNITRNKIQKNGMYTLGTWATGNIIIGTAGNFTTTGESKYFHQMNAGWNFINLGIAISGYISANREDINKLSISESIKKQRQTSNAFLFNSALNLSYITAGLYLKERANNLTDNSLRLKGYGNSFIMQGAFLLIFDLSNFFIHQNNRKRKLDPIFDNLTFNGNSVGLRVKIN